MISSQKTVKGLANAHGTATTKMTFLLYKKDLLWKKK